MIDKVVLGSGIGLCLGYAVEQPLLMLAAAGILAALLAAVRFDYFVIFLLVARSALDVTKGSGALSATTVLGALLIVVVGVREVLIRSTGQALPLLRSPVHTPLIALLAISVLSGALSDAPAASLTESLRLAGVVAMVIALERMLASGDAAAKVLTAVFLSSAVPMAFGLYQLVFGRGRSIGGFSRVQGTFTHPNPFSIYLAVLLVLAVALIRHVRGWARIGLAVVLVIGGGLLVATFTRGSWVALLVGVMVVGALQSRAVVAAMMAVVAVVVVAVPQVRARFTDLLGGDQATEGAGNSLVWRLHHWQDALALGRESPVIGIGLKGIERSTADGANAHNDLVRIGVETGFVGLLIYAALAAALIWTARRALRTAPDGWRRGAAVGYAGMLGVLGTASLSSNIITQVVLLWYVAAISIAVVAVSPSVAAPQGRRRSEAGDGSARSFAARTSRVTGGSLVTGTVVSGGHVAGRHGGPAIALPPQRVRGTPAEGLPPTRRDAPRRLTATLAQRPSGIPRRALDAKRALDAPGMPRRPGGPRRARRGGSRDPGPPPGSWEETSWS